MLSIIIMWNHVISFNSNFKNLVLQLFVIMVSEWNDVLTFIEEFKKYRYLWDPKLQPARHKLNKTLQNEKHETRNIHSVELL
jgi:hypothetical protein